MLPDRLEVRPIIPMRQTFEMGCGPTSVAMVLSGFGIDTNEQILAQRYFPTAMLPLIDPDSNELNRHSGVDDQHLLEGMVQIIDDMGLQNRLRVDVFDALLWEYTVSPQQRYIVEASPKSIRKYGERFSEDNLSNHRVRAFYQSLERLVKNRKVVVYTVNARMIQADKMKYMFTLPDYIKDGFFSELAEFVKKGHIVGPHGGMTAHIRALDGSKAENISWDANKEGFVMLDPDGESWVVSVSGLAWIDTHGVRGDIFDYLFRVSAKEALDPQQYSIRSFLKNLKGLLSR